REFVSITADDRKLAEELTLAGIAVEKIAADGAFEMEITTNRPDAMNHYGVAREASAIYDADLRPLSAKLPRARGMSNFQVEIEVPQYCSRFTGQVIRDVRIGPSGARVMKRFKELEQKPINNAADATNYVLLEMGKPTHAFDLDKLEGGKLIIRMARAGETLKTLDGVERKLHPEDVIVADAKKPVALAGIMGGWDSMITETTKSIVIESAWWDPAAIRRSCKRHIMHTDASHRFERGADWASCPLSTELVAEVILESGGELEGGLIDVIKREVRPRPSQLRLSEVRRILGKEIPPAEIERILRRLGFSLTTQKSSSAAGASPKAVVDEPGAYSVEIPTWRLDIEREIDIIEEIARIHGFNQFPNTLPAFQGGLVELPHTLKLEKVRRTLLALGYNEAISSTFVAKADSLAVCSDAPVEIANPLSEEAGAMRTSLLPGMLEMVARNLNRGSNEVRLFEAGHIFSMNGANTGERAALCLAATASAIARTKDATEVFRNFKGDIETLLSNFDFTSLYFDAMAGDHFHAGRSARAVLNGATIARFGQLHPDIAGSRKLKQEIYIAELALDRLFEHPLHQPRYQKLSRFPAIDRDFSFVFPDAVTFDQITRAVNALKLAELKSFSSMEIFRGGSVPAGQYSTLLRADFQSNERTLRDEEVAQWSLQITEALRSLGGVQRS
ncbi:MAG TPA: phenylalanine--tRNA ligase subunit beta, partial [Terriglobales bacterium]|nr:phenylalanine--tRNA ligase subunit beta [Terriglobales bacterium]